MNEPTELLPCPFCGAGESQIHVNKGTWNGRGYGEPVSVEVRHWCADVPGQPSRMISRAGRDEASAIAAWNTRTTTHAQAGAAPLTDIRKVALDLYTPPFRHEYGYIRDANHHMVAGDASSEATGLIAARIRGWGRIQYMDKPEMRANALQDEVAEMVAEALNAYWAANMALIDHGQYSGVVDIARNGIDEVIRLKAKAQAKQDDALIRQLVGALDGVHAGEHQGGVDEAIAAGRARLEGKT